MAQKKNYRAAKQVAKDVVYLYCLHDPRDGSGRYVGQTSRSIEYRLYEHIRAARAGELWPVSAWIRKLELLGLAPDARLLEVIQPGDDWKGAESRWIAKLRSEIGNHCLNATDGGDGARGYTHPPDIREKIRAIAIAQGRKPPRNKAPITDETRRRMSASQKEVQKTKPFKPTSEHHKKMLSGITMETRMLIGKKNSIALKGRLHTPERKAKTSAVMKEWWATRKLAQALENV